MLLLASFVLFASVVTALTGSVSSAGAVLISGLVVIAGAPGAVPGGPAPTTGTPARCGCCAWACG